LFTLDTISLRRLSVLFVIETPEESTGSVALARQRARGCSGFAGRGELVMAKHERPPQGSEKDGRTELDVAGLAMLAQEPKGGQHSVAEDEDDSDGAEE
jgi:hypothetical protein